MRDRPRRIIKKKVDALGREIKREEIHEDAGGNKRLKRRGSLPFASGSGKRIKKIVTNFYFVTIFLGVIAGLAVAWVSKRAFRHDFYGSRAGAKKESLTVKDFYEVLKGLEGQMRKSVEHDLTDEEKWLKSKSDQQIYQNRLREIRKGLKKLKD